MRDELTEAERLQAVLDGLAQPTRSSRRPLNSGRVAVAASAHIRSGLAWEWEQVDLRPNAPIPDLADVDLLVVETDGQTVQGWEAGPSPVDLAAAARARGVPVVAWVTASTTPTDESAALLDAFDVVFVADVDDAAAWQARWPDHGVEVLLPASQPREHAPVRPEPGFERPGDVLVVDDADGTDGQEDTLDVTLPPALVPSVDVWDRGSTALARIGTHAFDDLAGQYKVLADIGQRRPQATWRILDAMATRTAVVTTEARVERMPSDVRDVVRSADAADLWRHVSVLARQQELRDREAHVAQRTVLGAHTFTDRARTLLTAADIEMPCQDRTVSVVVPTNRPHELPNVLENVARQVRVSAELIIVGHGIEIDRSDIAARSKELGIERATVIDADANLTLGAVLNLGLDAASGAYVAKMDDDNYYGAGFLSDLLDTFTYTDAGIAGKWAHYVWLRSSDAVVLRFEQYEHAYHRLVQGGSIVAQRDVASDLRFSDIPRAVDSDFLNRAMALGVRTYSGDRFNFVSIRGADRNSHTWKVADLDFMTGSGRVVAFGDPRAHVSV